MDVKVLDKGDRDYITSLIRTSLPDNDKSLTFAKKILQNIAKNPERFTGILMEALTRLEFTTISQVKPNEKGLKAIFSVFNHMMKQTSSKKQREQINDLIVKTIYVPTVTPDIMNLLQKALRELYRSGPKTHKKNSALANEKLAKGQFSEILPSLLLILAYLKSIKGCREENAAFFLSSIKGLIEVCNYAFEEFDTKLFHFTFTFDPEKPFRALVTSVEILNQWGRIINEFIKSIGKKKPTKPARQNYNEVLLSNYEVYELLFKIMLLDIPQNNLLTTYPFMKALKEQLLQTMDNMKINSLTCLSSMLEIMIAENSEVSLVTPPILDIQQNRFYAMIRNRGLEKIMENIFQLVQEGFPANLENQKNNPRVSLLRGYLNAFTNCVPLNKLHVLFFKHRHDIFIRICLPLIVSTTNDIENSKEVSERFVGSCGDLIRENVQKGDKSLKTVSLSLLRKLCEHVDGLLSALVKLIGVIIHLSLISKDISLISQYYPELTEYKDFVFFSAVQSSSQVEACIFALTGLSSMILDRPDLLEDISFMIKENQAGLLDPQLDFLTKNRLCSFFSVLLVKLFKQDDEMFKACLDFIVDCATQKDPSSQKMLTEEAQVSLELVLSEANREHMNLPIRETLEKLTSYLAWAQTSKNIYSVLNFIVSTYSSNISEDAELIIKLAKALVEKGDEDYKHLTREKDSTKNSFKELCGLIVAIAEKENYAKFRDEIDEIVTPFFMSKVDGTVTVDSDLFDYVSATTKNTKKVSPLGWQVLQLAPGFVERNEWALAPLFEALHEIIIQGQDVIKEDKQIISSLMDACLKALSMPDLRESAICAAVLQVVIHHFEIEDEQWGEMLTACDEKFPFDNCYFLKVRLCEVILIAFQKRFDLTQAYFVEQDALEDILDTLLNQPIIYDMHAYDRKILTTSLSSILQQEKHHPVLMRRLPQMFDILLSYLVYIEEVGHKSIEDNKNDDDSDIIIYENGNLKLKGGFLHDRTLLRDYLNNNDAQEPVFEPEIEDNDDDAQGDGNGNGNGNGQDDDEENEDDYEDEDEEDDDEDEDDVYDDDEDVYYDDDDDEFVGEEEDDDIFEDEDEYTGMENGDFFGGNELIPYASRIMRDVKLENEFSAFREMISHLKENNSRLLSKLTITLPENKRKLLNDVLLIQNTVLKSEEVKIQPRKILKIRGIKNVELDENKQSSLKLCK